MSLNDEKKAPGIIGVPDDTLEGVAGGAGPDDRGNYICPHCREYALKLEADGLYHCSFCGRTSNNPF